MPARVIGAVRDAADGLAVRVGGERWTAPLAALADAYHGAIPRLMERAASVAATAGESRPLHTTP